MRPIVVVAALFPIVAAACGGDDDDAHTPTAGPEERPVATTRIDSGREDVPQYAYYQGIPETGTAVVDDAIRFLIEQGSDDLAGMVRPSMEPCVEDPPEGQLLPRCGDGQEEGTLVEALPTGRCVAGAIRIDDVEPLFRAATGADPGIHAVYEHSAGSDPVSPDAVYAVVVINRGDENSVSRFDLDEAGIVGVHLPCADEPYRLHEETAALYASDPSLFLLPVPLVE